MLRAPHVHDLTPSNAVSMSLQIVFKVHTMQKKSITRLIGKYTCRTYQRELHCFICRPSIVPVWRFFNANLAKYLRDTHLLCSDFLQQRFRNSLQGVLQPCVYFCFNFRRHFRLWVLYGGSFLPGSCFQCFLQAYVTAKEISRSVYNKMAKLFGIAGLNVI